MPPEAYHTIRAGSPRALIYDEADLTHRALIFGEADSLPAGEDNPAASAIRNLLQDHALHYDVTFQDPDTGQFAVKAIRKPGPTVLITTSTRRLGDQLDTRLFSLEVPEDIRKIRAALRTQARLANDPAPAPDPALVAFQSYLQLGAPWDVSVPFLDRLAEDIGRASSNSRILRDFARLTSFIKTVAVLRHSSRDRDASGRVVATLDDYETVRALVGDMYAGSVTGASNGVRRVVQAVSELLTPCSLQDVCNHLGPDTNKGSVSRWVRGAIANGWLVNGELQKKNRYALEIGEPIPESTVLPSSDTLKASGCKVAEQTGQTNETPTTTEHGITTESESHSLLYSLEDF